MRDFLFIQISLVNLEKHSFLVVLYGFLRCLCKPVCKPEITMKATVNVLCYKSKTLSNGEHPLMICLCKDNKRKYISIGASVNPRFWDFDKNKPKRNCPNKEQLNKLIAEIEQKYAEQVMEFSTMQRDYTATTLVETVDNSSKCKTVNDLFQHHIKQLMDENRLGYA